MIENDDIMEDCDCGDCCCDEEDEDCCCDEEEDEESNLIKHAKTEFKAAGWIDVDGKMEEMQDLMCRQVLELLKLFSSHGHSGTSAPYAVNMFKKLAMFEPIVPITGEDWEWTEVDDNMWQNKRCSHVFKGENGRAYDMEGKIFRESNGSCYTSKDSRVYIDFPYTPKREYVDV